MGLATQAARESPGSRVPQVTLASEVVRGQQVPVTLPCATRCTSRGSSTAKDLACEGVDMGPGGGVFRNAVVAV